MSYIGRQLNNLSDRVKLDSLTASATATYNLLLNTVAYVPSSAESLTVSLNGVIQAPQSSYTVSGSQITFASALTSSDSIDFILAERSITLQTPSAGSVGTSQLASSAVTTAKINADAVDGTKIADDSISDEHLDITAITGQTEKTSLADADKFLISDSAASGALKYVQKSNLNSGTLVLLDDTYISSSTASITYSSSLITDTYEQYIITGSAIQVASAGGGNILLHVSSDNGSSYYTGGTDYSRSVYVGESSLTSNTVISRSGDAGAVEVTGNAYDFGSGAYGNCGFVVRCFNLKNLATGSGARRLFELFSVYVNKDSTSNFVCNQGMAFFKGGTGEINNIKLSLSSSNTFGEGEFRLYGVA